MNIENLRAQVISWAIEDKSNGAQVPSDGGVPQITAEMIGRAVDELQLSEAGSDELRVELMGIWRKEVV